MAGFALAAALLAACQADELGYGPKSSRSVGGKTAELMQKIGVGETSPVLMRIFKEESKFEVWKADATGRYKLLKSYDICKWSGKLGPKIKEGDRQAPEGYYFITPGLMNPNSAYYLSFNTGFPNAFDRANGRTGSALMVHGACSSRGCYAMTDEQIGEIYALARDAFKGGQKAFQLQAYPFRMTAENMARHWDDPNMPFWKMLKEGYDTFELTRREPKVDVCGRKYVFNSTPKGSLNPVDACPELVKPADLQVALASKAKADEEKAVVLAAKFRAEREAEEQRQILIAQNIEEERKRAEAARLLAAERGKGDGGQLFASLAGRIAGIVTPGGTPADAAAPASETLAALAADGAGAAVTGPLPKPDPRTPEVALAMAEPAAAPAATGVGSMFGRLFSFGSGDAAEPSPVAEATTMPSAVAEAAQPSPVAEAAVPADARQPAASAPATQANPGATAVAAAPVRPVSPVAKAPADATVVASIAPPAAGSATMVRSLVPPSAPAAAPAPAAAATCAAPAPAKPGEPTPAQAACTPAATAAPPAVAAVETASPATGSKSIMDRIGSWF